MRLSDIIDDSVVDRDTSDTDTVDSKCSADNTANDNRDTDNINYTSSQKKATKEKRHSVSSEISIDRFESLENEFASYRTTISLLREECKELKSAMESLCSTMKAMQIESNINSKYGSHAKELDIVIKDASTDNSQRDPIASSTMLMGDAMTVKSESRGVELDMCGEVVSVPAVVHTKPVSTASCGYIETTNRDVDPFDPGSQYDLRSRVGVMTPIDTVKLRHSTLNNSPLPTGPIANSVVTPTHSNNGGILTPTSGTLSQTTPITISRSRRDDNNAMKKVLEFFNKGRSIIPSFVLGILSYIRQMTQRSYQHGPLDSDLTMNKMANVIDAITKQVTVYNTNDLKKMKNAIASILSTGLYNRDMSKVYYVSPNTYVTMTETVDDGKSLNNLVRMVLYVISRSSHVFDRSLVCISWTLLQGGMLIRTGNSGAVEYNMSEEILKKAFDDYDNMIKVEHTGGFMLDNSLEDTVTRICSHQNRCGMFMKCFTVYVCKIVDITHSTSTVLTNTIILLCGALIYLSDIKKFYYPELATKPLPTAYSDISDLTSYANTHSNDPTIKYVSYTINTIGKMIDDHSVNQPTKLLNRLAELHMPTT